MKRSAFTLVELLVAVALLLLILVLLVGAIGAVANTWKNGVARIDSFTKARVVMNLLDRDLHAAVLRRDLAAFVDERSNAACAFYAKVNGSAGDRRLALIRYLRSADDAVLRREDYGLDYTNRGLTLTETNSLTDLAKTSSQNLADGIIGFNWQFLSADGSLRKAFQYDYDQPESPSNTKALVISLLVLDDSALRRVRDQGELAALLGAFAISPPSGQSYAEAWDALMNSPAFGSTVPAAARGGLRVFQRRVLLP